MRPLSETISEQKNKIIDQYEFGHDLYEKIISRISPNQLTLFSTEQGILEQLQMKAPEGFPVTVLYTWERSDGNLSICKMFFTKKPKID